MAIERRDNESQAKLFVPTKGERSVRSQREKLKKSLSEVDELKEELAETIKAMKKNMDK